MDAYERDLIWLQEIGEKVYYDIDLTAKEKMQLIGKIQDNMEEIQILDKRLRTLEEKEEKVMDDVEAERVR